MVLEPGLITGESRFLCRIYPIQRWVSAALMSHRKSYDPQDTRHAFFIKKARREENCKKKLETTLRCLFVLSAPTGLYQQTIQPPLLCHPIHLLGTRSISISVPLEGGTWVCKASLFELESIRTRRRKTRRRRCRVFCTSAGRYAMPGFG